MHKTFLTALAAATLFSIGMPANRAEARTTTTPSTLGVATAGLVHEAAIVCGGNGCNPVHTKAQSKRKFQTLGHG